MNSQEDLEQLYRGATYVVHDSDDDLMIRLGRENAELGSLMRKAGAQRWAFLTAYNPNSQPADQELNEERQLQLIGRLNLMGLRFLQGYGTGENWEREPSLFILDISKEAALDLGREFGQSAILFGGIGGEPELLWCVPVDGPPA